MAEEENEIGVVTEPETRRKLKRPRQFKVLLHNDDYTTREFVVEVLKRIFRKDEGEAVRVMLHVHYNGVGVAGLYSREVAETKIETVHRLAREREFPLRLTMEPEDGAGSDEGGSD